MRMSTIKKHLDKNSPPWECDKFQDNLLNFLTKEEERTEKEYYWSYRDIQSDKLRKKDEYKCRYPFRFSAKASIVVRGYFNAQTELFTENVQKPNAKSEKLKKLIEARSKFYELLPDLIRDHKGKYVAVVNDNVEIDSDKDVLLDRVIQKHGYVSMYLDKISDKQKVIKLGHRPRLRRK